MIIKPYTASGPDGIQAVLLKNAGSSLSFPLAQLYQFYCPLALCPRNGNLHRLRPFSKKVNPVMFVIIGQFLLPVCVVKL